MYSSASASDDLFVEGEGAAAQEAARMLQGVIEVFDAGAFRPWRRIFVDTEDGAGGGEVAP